MPSPLLLVKSMGTSQWQARAMCPKPPLERALLPQEPFGDTMTISGPQRGRPSRVLGPHSRLPWCRQPRQEWEPEWGGGRCWGGLRRGPQLPPRRYANGSPQEGRPCAQRGPFVIPSPNGREKASPRELPPSPSRSGSSWAQMPRTDPGISLPLHGLGLGLPSTARGRTLLGGQGRGRFVSWKDSVKPQTSFFWQSARRLIDERVSCARAAKIFHDVSGARQCLGFAWQAWHRGEAAWGCVEFQQESVPLLDLTGSFIKG